MYMYVLYIYIYIFPNPKVFEALNPPSLSRYLKEDGCPPPVIDLNGRPTSVLDLGAKGDVGVAPAEVNFCVLYVHIDGWTNRQIDR